VVSVRSVPRLYKENHCEISSFGVEAGSNASTVTLRVVGGDEEGSLKSDTVKYGLEYQGTRTRERLLWQGPAAYTKNRLVLSSERAPHKKQDRNCQTVINIWSWAPDGARHQDLLADWPSVAMWLWLRLEFRLSRRLAVGISNWAVAVVFGRE
jgi:hypothetical protein